MKHPQIVLGILSFLVLLSGMEGGWESAHQADIPNKPEQLYPEVGVFRKLDGIETGYGLTLYAGEYFEITLEKTGTDIALLLFQPDARIIRSVNCSHDGPSHISEVASVSGRYFMKLNACEQSSLERFYKLTLSQERTATRADRLRVAGERLSADADSLIAEYRASSVRTAVRKYEEALGHWIAIGDYVEEVDALNNISRLYRDLGDLERGISYANRALALARNNGRDPAGEANANLSIAMIYLNHGNATKALEASWKALDIARTVSNRGLEAEVQYFLGSIYYESINDYDRATDAFEEAGSIWRSTNNRIGEVRCVLYLSMIDFDLSRLDAGSRKSQQVLPVFRSLKDIRGEARTMTLLGHFQRRMGRNQEALNIYEKARPLVIDSGDFLLEAALLNGIANVYYTLGDGRSALQFYEMALAKNEELHDRVGIAYSFRAIGECYFAVGDAQKALSYLNRALNAFRDLSNKRMVARVLEKTGLIYESLGDMTRALDVLNRSLELSRSTNDPRLEASARTGIGHIFETAGETDRALQYYGQAVELSRAAVNPFGEVSILYQIAHSLRTKGELTESLSQGEIAIRLIEGTRADVANSALRTSYFASVRQQYELYIDVLMRLFREKGSAASEITAFEASERSRARTLLESIGEARVSISEGVDPEELEREVSLKALVEAKAERYTQLLSNNAASKDLVELSDDMRRLNAEYEQLQGQIKMRSPRYAALTQPEPLRLTEVQQGLLDGDSLLIEYALGEENSYLWAVTRDDFRSYVVPKRSEIEKKVRRLRELMTARVALPGEKLADFQARVKAAEIQYLQAAAELSQILIGPVAERLGTRRLIVVAEGVLQYLPFGALPTPQSIQSSSFTPLIVEHEVVNLPSASTLAVIRREAPSRGSPDRTVAVFADPVFQAADSRVHKPRLPASSAQSNPGRTTPRTAAVASIAQMLRGSDALGVKIDLPRLPSTRLEAEAILGMVPEQQRLAALGFNATKAAAMNPDLKRYRIVHFATHTVLNDDHPDLSSLVLSLVDERGNPQSGFLRLRDMYNLHLAAELVVLSACDTALGKEVKGEGLMSMVRGFMYSGTPRVLASLWKVDDEATAELMKEFYKQVLQSGLSPAAALRQAQIAQMQKKSRQSPYYWAGFQLQGEWN